MINRQLTLAERTTEFSKNVLLYCKNEKPSYITRSLIEQLVRSSTSIGANYAEANNAASKTDFRNKIFIAKKEAAETEYWLSLLKDHSVNKEICTQLSIECHYLLMILQKIINTLNSKRITENVR